MLGGLRNSFCLILRIGQFLKFTKVVLTNANINSQNLFLNFALRIMYQRKVKVCPMNKLQCVEILSYADRNMAMQEWVWRFTLSVVPDGSLTLSAVQIIVYADDQALDLEDQPFEVDPIAKIKNGADIYLALIAMFDNIGIETDTLDLPKIAEKIWLIDERISGDFLAAESILDDRQYLEDSRLDQIRDDKLRPFLSLIEVYCANIKEPIIQTESYASRDQIKRFLTNFVLEHEKLPNGVHRWRTGYKSSSCHDFSDIS